MGLELEKPRVTELQLRMDCNGCVHKIKKAILRVDGVYDISIDFANQKLTVVGRAELDKILRAIKKTRKIATICSHTDPNVPPEPEPPTEPPPAPDAAAASQPPAETPAAKPEEPLKEPAAAPPQENQAPEAKPSVESKPKVIEEIHMVHHYPYNYNYNRQCESPRYVYQWPPVLKNQCNWVEAYEEDYYYSRRRGDGNKVTSIFSEENPNNCAIM